MFILKKNYFFIGFLIRLNKLIFSVTLFFKLFSSTGTGCRLPTLRLKCFGSSEPYRNIFNSFMPRASP